MTVVFPVLCTPILVSIRRARVASAISIFQVIISVAVLKVFVSVKFPGLVLGSAGRVGAGSCGMCVRPNFLSFARLDLYGMGYLWY